MEIGSEQHEPQIRFRRNDAECQKLGFIGGSDLLNQRRYRGFGLNLFLLAQQPPGSVVDAIKQVEDMPTFFRTEYIRCHSFLVWLRPSDQSPTPSTPVIARLRLVVQTPDLARRLKLPTSPRRLKLRRLRRASRDATSGKPKRP